MGTARSKSVLAAERVHDIWDYDPLTGILRWRISPSRKMRIGAVAGTLNDGYIIICFEGKNYKGHRLAWAHVHGVWPEGDLDHEDTIRSHNWIKNLRPASRSQNLANMTLHPRNSTGYKGVTFNKRAGKYYAQIHKNGQNFYLGIFHTPEEAHAAYRAKAVEFFGEFANDGS